ncbi:GreA/GreB family elongation factor [Streptomyces zinciresistens K42]|uniref:GreA/GreB family elongation factor n=1 Tax=Streptomyces zinciresistens K42 TaxID=700597 RepID=G2GEE1_9ACTN|nr:GreA/GreB family elongation factor [Streptomyces zinciresistens]EGX58116.1 GreA/GreB family elongation factor [Streptomyces zinciresistens K42]
MSSEPAPLSEAGRQALEQELSRLRAEREKVASTLRDSDAAVGDLADAADELQRANDVRRVDARIAEITTRLRSAVAAGPPRTDRVGVGGTVTVRFGDGAEETFQIGETTMATEHSLVTADSPLGRALLGHRPGDTVRYHAPGGSATAVVVSLGAAG